jgi:hypothetical protein
MAKGKLCPEASATGGPHAKHAASAGPASTVASADASRSTPSPHASGLAHADGCGTTSLTHAPSTHVSPGLHTTPRQAWRSTMGNVSGVCATNVSARSARMQPSYPASAHSSLGRPTPITARTENAPFFDPLGVTTIDPIDAIPPPVSSHVLVMTTGGLVAMSSLDPTASCVVGPASQPTSVVSATVTSVGLRHPQSASARQVAAKHALRKRTRCTIPSVACRGRGGLPFLHR